MQDPRSELLPPPSSPTISSVSSSDLDTESTGSFFHDRSITLGTLMGVNFPAINFRASSQHQGASPSGVSSSSGARLHKKRGSSASADHHHRRRKWWRLCRDGDNGSPAVGDGRPSSLGEFLAVERRFGDEAFYSAPAAELEGAVGRDQRPSGGRALFADGRVLPPAYAADDEADTRDETSAASSAICRFPVSLTGICSGGGG